MLEGVITVIFGILFYVSRSCILSRRSMQPALLLLCCTPDREMPFGCGCMLLIVQCFMCIAGAMCATMLSLSPCHV